MNQVIYVQNNYNSSLSIVSSNQSQMSINITSPQNNITPVSIIETPQSQLSSTNHIEHKLNIINNKPGEIDDNIDDALSTDIDIDEYKDFQQEMHEHMEQSDSDNNEPKFIDEDKVRDRVNTENKRINLLFGDRSIRALYMNATLFCFCILSFPLWLDDVTGIDEQTNIHVANAYILATFSMFVTFTACGSGLLFSIFDMCQMKIPFQQIVRKITMTMYFVGGFFYFVAACGYAHFYDESNLGAIWWSEMFYVSIYVIILGIDFWKPFLNRLDYRIYTFFILYIFCALILMFSYIICWNKLNDKGFISIGMSYLFGFIVSIIFLIMCMASNILTKEFVIKPKLDSIKPTFDLILSVLMFIFMFFTVIAYWVTERITDTEKVYYTAFGIFMLSMTVLMTFDMRFSLYIARFIEVDDDNK